MNEVGKVIFGGASWEREQPTAARWWLVAYPARPGFVAVRQVEWLTPAEADVKWRATGVEPKRVNVVEAAENEQGEIEADFEWASDAWERDQER